MELVEPEYIVHVKDAKALSDRIKLFMENDELRWQAGSRNLKKIREYTIENMARVHVDILRERERNGWFL